MSLGWYFNLLYTLIHVTPYLVYLSYLLSLFIKPDYLAPLTSPSYPFHISLFSGTCFYTSSLVYCEYDFRWSALGSLWVEWVHWYYMRENWSKSNTCVSMSEIDIFEWLSDLGAKIWLVCISFTSFFHPCLSYEKWFINLKV